MAALALSQGVDTAPYNIVEFWFPPGYKSWAGCTGFSGRGKLCVDPGSGAPVATATGYCYAYYLLTDYGDIPDQPSMSDRPPARGLGVGLDLEL